jgi:ABC-type transport system substrate-binding protein
MMAVLALAASCGSSNQQSAGGPGPAGTLAPQNGGNLVMGIPADGTGWNPGMTEMASWTMLEGSTMLEPLAMADSNGNAQPWLAKSFTPNATFDVWTLKLQPNVSFTDGTPFDASAVKANMDFLVTAPVSSMAFAGSFKDAQIIDPLTLEIDLTEPWASFPSSFLDVSLMISPKTLASPDHGVSHPVGTGPFVFQSWTPNQMLKVTKNPNYWRAGLPHLNSVEFRIIPDASTAAQALSSGDIDAFETTDATVVDEAGSSAAIAKDYKSVPTMVLANTLASPGGAPNPVANQHVRNALALATDRKAIADGVGQGIESPTAPFPPESEWGLPYDQNGYPDFDLNKAKDEVAAYEKETGQSSVSLTLTATADAAAVKVVQQLQQMWQAAGITVSLQNVDASALLASVIVGKYELAMAPVYTALHPDVYHYFWSSNTAQGYGKLSINMTQYTTPKMDQDLTTLRTTDNLGSQKTAYNDLVQQINGARTNIWLYWTPFAVLYNQRVHGMDAAASTHVGTLGPKGFLDDVWLQS